MRVYTVDLASWEKIKVSKIFRRPMFRRGGNVGDGIMTGIVDREMHGLSDKEGVGGQSSSERIKEALAPFNKPAFDPVSQLLIQGGLRGFSETGGGSTFGNLAKGFIEPTEQFFKSTQDRQDAERDIALAGVESDISTELKQEEMRLTAENAQLKRTALATEGDLDRKNEIDKQILKNESELEQLQFKLDNPDAAGMQVIPAFENVVESTRKTFENSKNPAVKRSPDLTAFNLTKFRREADPKILARYKGFKEYGYNRDEIVAKPTTRFSPGDIIYDPLNADFLVFDNTGGTYKLNPLTFEIEE